jgi:hypothetical protein
VLVGQAKPVKHGRDDFPERRHARYAPTLAAAMPSGGTGGRPSE